MKINFKCMFLNSHSGTDQKTGSVYYYGSFLDKESGNTFNLYFDNMDFLKRLEPYKDYDIPCVLYLSSISGRDGFPVKVWKLIFDKEAKV